MRVRLRRLGHWCVRLSNLEDLLQWPRRPTWIASTALLIWRLLEGSSLAPYFNHFSLRVFAYLFVSTNTFSQISLSSRLTQLWNLFASRSLPWFRWEFGLPQNNIGLSVTFGHDDVYVSFGRCAGRGWPARGFAEWIAQQAEAVCRATWPKFLTIWEETRSLLTACEEKR